MKTARRHELQTNDLADWVSLAMERAQPYGRAMGALALATVVLVAAYFIVSGRSVREKEELWQEYFRLTAEDSPEDLEKFAKQHAGTEVSVWAHLLAADSHLADGMDALFSDRKKAQTELDDAETGYRAAAKAAKVPLLQQRASIGLARTLESQGELKEAREEYESYVSRWPEGTYASAAKARAEDLKKGSTKEFYDWFEEQEPAPKATGLEGFDPHFGDMLSPPGGKKEPSQDGSLFPSKIKIDGEDAAPEGTTPEAEGTEESSKDEPASSDEASPPAEGNEGTPPATSGDAPEEPAAPEKSQEDDPAGESSAPPESPAQPQP